MKISVIGLGYLGATHAVAMASLGHEVIGIEPDSIRTAQLKAGKIPFHEPGLQQALDKVLAAGNIAFRTSTMTNQLLPKFTSFALAHHRLPTKAPTPLSFSLLQLS
jgi:UDP-glucose 6-dehydrogenase